MPIKPYISSNESLTIEFLINGENTGMDSLLKEGTVNFELNKIPFAKFSFISSNADTDKQNSLPIDALKNDDEIEVKITVDKEAQTFFKGFIKSVDYSANNQQKTARVECKDLAFNLTLPSSEKENNNESFEDKLNLFTNKAKLQNNLKVKEWGSEKITHNSSVVPWDYLLGFIDSVGVMAAVRNGEFNGVDILEDAPEEKYFAENGINILSFSGKTDETKKLSKASIEFWDSKSQKLEKVEKEQSKVKPNIKNIRLSENRLSASTVQKMVDTYVEKGKLATIYGKISTFGNLNAKAGDYLTCNKVNEKIDLKPLLITQETHTIENGCWKTAYSFGLENDQSFTENTPRKNNAQQVQTGQTNTINGLQIGVVTQIEEDPNNEFRIKVKIPVLSEDGEGVWARLATLNASKDMGSYFIPDVNDEVIVGCLGNNPDTPIILGSVYSSANPMAFPIAEENYKKGFVTKEGTKIVMDDEKKSIELSTNNGNKFTISDDLKGIVLEDENSNKITLNDQGITIESCKDLNIKANGNIKVEGVQVGMEASAIMEIKGSMINLN